jgi:hypothetical protein
MRFLARLYARRIVNVNVNVVTAGLMAMAVTVGAMHLADRTGLLTWLGSYVPDFHVTLPKRVFKVEGEKLVVSGLTFLVDVVSDVAVYYGLHFLANHLPRRLGMVSKGAHAHLSFMRDATLVQFERALLSPMLYAAALITQNTLLHQGWSVEAATAIGLGTGMGLTRCIHTLWMMQQERRAAERAAKVQSVIDQQRSAAVGGPATQREPHKASA